jgi:hypothetical protein
VLLTRHLIWCCALCPCKLFKMKADVAERFVTSPKRSPPLLQHSRAISNERLAPSSRLILSLTVFIAKKKPGFLRRSLAIIRSFGTGSGSPIAAASKLLMLSSSGTFYSCKTISNCVGKNFNSFALCRKGRPFRYFLM